MVVLNQSQPFYKVEFIDPDSSQVKSVFSPNVFLETEKPSDDSSVSSDIYISHLSVNSKLDASVNTSELEIRHGVGATLPVLVDDKLKIYLGFYDQDKTQGPEYSLAFTGSVAKIKNGFEKTIVSCKSKLQKITKKKTKLTFSSMMGIKDLINKFAIDLGGLELSQTGIADTGINKQPGFGITQQEPLIEHIKKLARYSSLDVFSDVFDKFHASLWEPSKLKTPSSSDTPWITARGKTESENCDFYKHKVLFDQNLMDVNFDIFVNNYSGVEVVSLLPFSEEIVHTIEPVKVEYKSANPDDSEKPMKRYKLSHVIREDAEKIAENLFKFDAGKLRGKVKLLSAPQIRVNDGLMFDSTGMDKVPFGNIKFDAEGGANKLTDIVFQVVEVQHKFDTVEGFVSIITLRDKPTAAGAVTTTTAATAEGAPGLGVGVSPEAEYAGVAAAEAADELPITVSNAQWDREEARQGDLVTLTAEVEGAPDGTQGEIEIYEHDVDGIHDLIATLQVDVVNNKIKTTWEYEYHEDTDEIPTEEELKKYGRSYNPPEYFFAVKVRDAEDISGILLYKDYVEIYLKNPGGEPIADEDYILTLPDGTEIEGKVDSKGYAKVEGIPPGKVSVRFPNL
jgi:hypothetical protein